MLGGGDDAGAEVILEPTAASGDDPFTDSVATENVNVEGGGVKQVSGGKGGVESIEGSAPGLYGGTGDQAACDPKAMVGFLKKNPGKAAAFAGVLAIKPDQIEDYVAKLTPLLLREDTRVTNHGFKNGQATPLQSVLQAGTAVMVDDRGVPRVRCACGNPLTEPAAVSSSPEFKGQRWESFDNERLVAVSASRKPVKNFEVVNVRTGKPYVQAAGGAETIVMSGEGVASRVGRWRVKSGDGTVADAAKVFGSDYKTKTNSFGICESSWSSLGLKALSSSGAAGNCIPEGQLVLYVLVTSPNFETEAGLRVGMSDADVTRLYPKATTEQESGQPLDDEIYSKLDDIYTLVSVRGFDGRKEATLAALMSSGRVIALQATTQRVE